MTQKGLLQIMIVVFSVTALGLAFLTLYQNSTKQPKPVEFPESAYKEGMGPPAPAANPEPTPKSPLPEKTIAINPQLELRVRYTVAGKILGDPNKEGEYNAEFVNNLPDDIGIEQIDFEFFSSLENFSPQNMPRFEINIYFSKLLYNQPPPYPNFRNYTLVYPISVNQFKDLGNGKMRYKLAKPLVIPSEDKKFDKEDQTFIVLYPDKWPSNINEIRITAIYANTGGNNLERVQLVNQGKVNYISFYK